MLHDSCPPRATLLLLTATSWSFRAPITPLEPAGAPSPLRAQTGLLGPTKSCTHTKKEEGDVCPARARGRQLLSGVQILGSRHPPRISSANTLLRLCQAVAESDRLLV